MTPTRITAQALVLVSWTGFAFSFIRKLWCIALTLAATGAMAATHPETYDEALELIHAYNGSGDELQRAMQLIRGLARSHPNSGYAQTLFAEALSTWQLDQKGQPVQLAAEIVALCEEALQLNPNLAQAHVAKGMAFARASLYGPAESSIDAALSLDPTLSGAMFLRAEVFRRTGALSDAEQWYRRFIAAVPSTSRKANGYHWIGKMYADAGWNDATNRQSHAAKARESYERMLSLTPNGAWSNVNYAIFLNDYPADFEMAERYAQRALEVMEFPMARYHLAAARYQKIWASSSAIPRTAQADAARHVAMATGVSLENAIAFSSFSAVVRGRLQEFHAQLVQRRSNDR